MEVAGIYSHFRRDLLRYIKGKVRSAEEAEDILHNVFIKIAANIQKLADDQKLSNWIYAITRNAIIDYYRSNAARRSMQLLEVIESDIQEPTNSDPTLGLDKCISGMINLLPQAYRDIIIDSEIKGISQKQLAKSYGMAYSSLRSRVQRGRDRLKNLLHNCCHIESDRHGNVLAVVGKSDCNGSCNMNSFNE